jgi:glutathione synthase/RimK-type ligase-like ATP-grasp enzyme
MSTPRRVVALFRKASYSPNQHRTNDTAILEETISRLLAGGWSAARLDETAIENAFDTGTDSLRSGTLPDAELYLNMCQGPLAATALSALEASGACVLNRPASVLACHRHRLVPAMMAAGIPFPLTEILDLASTDDVIARSALVELARRASEPIWIKRGDVHAERSEDVVMVRPSEVAAALDAFRNRGIRRISLQRHVSGPVVKFYAVADRGFFRYYDAEAGPSGARPMVDEERLRDIAFAAAEAVGLSIFGGDVVVPSPDTPVLIDLNDWPSFAPFRHAAAAHIAAYAALRSEEAAPSRPSIAARESTAPQQPSPFSSLASDLA